MSAKSSAALIDGLLANSARATISAMRTSIAENVRYAKHCHRELLGHRRNGFRGPVLREYYHLRRTHMQLARQAQHVINLLAGVAR